MNKLFEGATTGGGAGLVTFVPLNGAPSVLLDGVIVGDDVGPQSEVFASDAGLPVSSVKRFRASAKSL